MLMNAALMTAKKMAPILKSDVNVKHVKPSFSLYDKPVLYTNKIIISLKEYQSKYHSNCHHHYNLYGKVIDK